MGTHSSKKGAWGVVVWDTRMREGGEAPAEDLRLGTGALPCERDQYSMWPMWPVGGQHVAQALLIGHARMACVVQCAFHHIATNFVLDIGGELV